MTSPELPTAQASLAMATPPLTASAHVDTTSPPDPASTSGAAPLSSMLGQHWARTICASYTLGKMQNE